VQVEDFDGGGEELPITIPMRRIMATNIGRAGGHRELHGHKWRLQHRLDGGGEWLNYTLNAAVDGSTHFKSERLPAGMAALSISK